MMFTRQIVIPVLAKYPDARMRLLEHARQRLMALNDCIGMDRETDDMGGVTRKEGCAVGFGNILQSGDAHLFAASSIFQDADVEFLHQLSSRMSTKKFDEGKTIIVEGDEFRAEQDYIYWIGKGQVEVWKGGNFVNLLGEGDVFGELAAFGNGRRQATVKSKTKVVLRVVKGAALIELLRLHEDEELMLKWEADQDKRMAQLTRKDELMASMRCKPVHLDFMFMKLQSVGADGVRVPKNEPLDLGMYAHHSEKDALSKSKASPVGKLNLDRLLPSP
jgi:CRP-like cAMP-binding protein